VFLKFYGIRLIFDFRGALLDGDPIMGHWFWNLSSWLMGTQFCR